MALYSSTHVTAVKWMRDNVSSDAYIVSTPSADGAVRTGEVHLSSVREAYGSVTRVSQARVDGEGVCVEEYGGRACVGTATGRVATLACVAGSGGGAASLEKQGEFAVASRGAEDAGVTALASGRGLFVGTEAGSIGLVDVEAAAAVASAGGGGGRGVVLAGVAKLCQLPVVGLHALAPEVCAAATARGFCIWDARVAAGVVLGPQAYDDPTGVMTCLTGRHGGAELYIGARHADFTGSVHSLDTRLLPASGAWAANRLGVTKLGRGQHPTVLAFSASGGLLLGTPTDLVECSVHLDPSSGLSLARSSQTHLLPPRASPVAIDVSGTQLAVGTAESGLLVADCADAC